MDLGLRDRACVVTGASRGIGAATAVGLAAEGASVLLVGRDGDALRAVAEACEDRGGHAEPLVLDVTDPGAGARVLSTCLERYARVDALVNNAGTSFVRPLEELTDEDWQAQWELHVMAPMRLMRELAPAMARARMGEDRQRLLVLGQASVANQRRLLGDQGSRALAVPSLRR